MFGHDWYMLICPMLLLSLVLAYRNDYCPRISNWFASRCGTRSWAEFSFSDHVHAPTEEEGAKIIRRLCRRIDEARAEQEARRALMAREEAARCDARGAGERAASPPTTGGLSTEGWPPALAGALGAVCTAADGIRCEARAAYERADRAIRDSLARLGITISAPSSGRAELV